MNLEAFLQALSHPAEAVACTPINVAVLFSSSSFTPSERQLASEDVVHVIDRFSLGERTGTAGSPAERGGVRVSPSWIAVWEVALLRRGRAHRVAELLHLATPWPQVLVLSNQDGFAVSVAGKFHDNAVGKRVLSRHAFSPWIQAPLSAPDLAFCEAMSFRGLEQSGEEFAYAAMGRAVKARCSVEVRASED